MSSPLEHSKSTGMASIKDETRNAKLQYFNCVIHIVEGESYNLV